MLCGKKFSVIFLTFPCHHQNSVATTVSLFYLYWHWWMNSHYLECISNAHCQCALKYNKNSKINFHLSRINIWSTIRRFKRFKKLCSFATNLRMFAVLFAWSWKQFPSRLNLNQKISLLHKKNDQSCGYNLLFCIN